jgi:hypothetical protein
MTKKSLQIERELRQDGAQSHPFAGGWLARVRDGAEVLGAFEPRLSGLLRNDERGPARLVHLQVPPNPKTVIF